MSEYSDFFSSGSSQSGNAMVQDAANYLSMTLRAASYSQTGNGNVNTAPLVDDNLHVENNPPLIIRRQQSLFKNSVLAKAVAAASYAHKGILETIELSHYREGLKLQSILKANFPGAGKISGASPRPQPANIHVASSILKNDTTRDIFCLIYKDAIGESDINYQQVDRRRDADNFGVTCQYNVSPESPSAISMPPLKAVVVDPVSGKTTNGVTLPSLSYSGFNYTFTDTILSAGSSGGSIPSGTVFNARAVLIVGDKRVVLKDETFTSTASGKVSMPGWGYSVSLVSGNTTVNGAVYYFYKLASQSGWTAGFNGEISVIPTNGSADATGNSTLPLSFSGFGSIDISVLSTLPDNATPVSLQSHGIILYASDKVIYSDLSGISLIGLPTKTDSQRLISRKFNARTIAALNLSAIPTVVVPTVNQLYVENTPINIKIDIPSHPNAQTVVIGRVEDGYSKTYKTIYEGPLIPSVMWDGTFQDATVKTGLAASTTADYPGLRKGLTEWAAGSDEVQLLPGDALYLEVAKGSQYTIGTSFTLQVPLR